MSASINNSLIGLSLLTRSSTVAGGAPTTAVESRAVRLAKAQYRLAPVTPPWRQPASGPQGSARLSAIRRLPTIVDADNKTGLPADVLTAFTTYKALDRLQLLAGAAATGGIAATERAALQKTFASGIADLQHYLATAPTDRLKLFLETPAKRVESVLVQTSQPAIWDGAAVGPDRLAPLAGVSGTEHLELTLGRHGSTDRLVVDLAQGAQPPTLDSVAAALNAAIASVPMRDAEGGVVLDASGNPQPRWGTSFAVVKHADGWGLQLRTMGYEEVGLRDLGARDALVVAATQSAGGQPSSVSLSRFGSPETALTRTALETLSAVDGAATAAARLLPQPAPLLPDRPGTAVSTAAALSAQSSVTDADGFIYTVGTSKGDGGALLGDGADDLVLFKLGSDGEVIWQRNLGTAGSADGVAVTLSADGGILVAGTAAGDTNGVPSDGDLLVAKFGRDGGEQFLQLIRAVGSDQATALTAGDDGSIYVGGRNAAGEAILARLDAQGRLVERQRLDGGTSGSVRSLAVDGDGTLLVLTQSNGSASLRRFGAASLTSVIDRADLGAVDARVLEVDGAGQIAVGGTQAAALSRDGVVVRLNQALAIADQTVLASAGDDRIDSMRFQDGKLYVAGRTAGDLAAARAGAVDGFVARLDPASGGVEAISQWGRSGTSIGNVQLSEAPGALSAVSALGFRHGPLNPASSLTLVSQTSLRAGDSIRLRVGDGPVRSISVTAEDTLDMLTKRIADASRSAGVRVTSVKEDGGYRLRIEAAPGYTVTVLNGPPGRDALPKLGLAPVRLAAAPPADPKAPRVQPGGSYGLELSPALNLKDEASAKLALARLRNAVSTTQSAFRSLYWDENKAAIVDGAVTGRVSAYQSKQLGRYQDVLARLSGGQ